MTVMGQTIRIFIADASRESTLLLRRLLEQEPDLEVVGVASRGDEALRRFPGSGADLLLCDLLLPGLDGISLLRRLRTDGALPHAIILSGFYNDRIALQASVVADNFLPKPCGAEDLVCHIRECVLGIRPRDKTPVRFAVRSALLYARVMPHLDGFRYLLSALERTWADPSLLRGVTKSLYRDVAKEFGTTAACVERSIRTSIERAWEQMEPAVRVRLFGHCATQWTKAPSNVPFLTAMTVLLDGQADVRRFGETQ